MSEIYPVVHINDRNTARDEAMYALDSGADGVYLIDHKGSDETVFETYSAVRSHNPSAYIGMNLLGNSSADAVLAVRSALRRGAIPDTPHGLWVDDIDDDYRYLGRAMEVKQSDEDLSRMRILGGIAFKYTKTFTDDPMLAARETARLREYVDVVTTSGRGTGHAPSADKIHAMSARLGGKKLAVASGISEQNFHEYDGKIDEVLVSSSVETEPYSGAFDRQKLSSMIAVVQGKK